MSAAPERLSRAVDQADVIGQFEDALRARGIIPPQRVLTDAKLHRCNVEGRGGKGDAAYVLHLDGIPAGGFQNWRDGLGWKDWCADVGRSLTTVEREELRQKMALARAEREAEEIRRQAEAAAIAEAIWREVPACDDHPYLNRKGVKPHGVRLSRGKLVVPVRDTEGKLHSLQFIGEDGGKKFLSGGRIKGGYFEIGEPGGVILIGEGYATCASAHEATGYPVAVAFDCGNLLAVAEALRAKYPNAQFVLLADDDYRTIGNPGVAKAREAAAAVAGVVAAPDFGPNRPDDFKDFNDMSNFAGAAAVKVLIDSALAAGNNEPSPRRKLLALNVIEFLSREIEPRKMLLAPILPTQGLLMLHSWRGVGKTHIAIGIAYAAACGGSFLRWKASGPARVLYLDGEMPASVMQERIAAAASLTEPSTPDHLRIITPDVQPHGMPNLGSEEGRAAVEEWIADGCDLLVIDNISTLCRLGKENESESWEPMQTWLLDLRRRGISVLLVHHAGKGGAQRGTSRREDILDTVISLRRPDDYDPTEGARFEVHLEKSRGIFGEEAAPFEARLEMRDGSALWTMRGIEDVKLARAHVLFAEGTSVRDVADELGISKSAAGRLKKKVEGVQ